jgi:magnesium chelatase family protein
MYPCPCGFFSDPERQCTCSLQTVTRYQKRISGPILDRIDIHIEVPRVDFEKLSDSRRGESSETIRARVEAARQRQCERFADLNNGMMTNADMRVAEVRQFCELDEAGQQLVKAAMTQLQLSARAYHRILKLARTIADLAGDENIQSAHLAEALQYRPKGMMV